MRTPEFMMHQLMRTMATGDGFGEVKGNVAELGHCVTRLDTNFDDIDKLVDNFDEHIAGLEERLHKAVAGEWQSPPRAAPTETPRSASGMWMPRIAHVRGLSPYGSAAENVLSKEDAKALQARISAGMYAEWHDRTRWLSHLMQNHCVRWELLLIEHRNEVKKLADYSNMTIKGGSIHIADQDLRASVETSPRRREHLRQWLQTREHLTQLNPRKEWAVCERALDIWNKKMTKRLGYRDATTGSWTWNKHAAAQEGLRLPVDINEPPDNRKQRGENAEKEENIHQDSDMKVEGEQAQPEQVQTEEDPAATPRRARSNTTPTRTTMRRSA